MPVLIFDFETRSVTDIRKCGAVKYACDASTEVLCCAFTVDSGPVRLWLPGNPIPDAFIEAASDPSWLVAAFNFAFEGAIIRHVLAPRLGWPLVPQGRCRCLQASALAHALPASLSGAAEALELGIRKDTAGRRVMLQLSRPRKPRKGEDPAGIYWHDDPVKHDILRTYCRQDVAAERALYQCIGFLSPVEQAHWELDQAINSCGVPLDRPLLDAAIRIAEAAQAELDTEMTRVTAGAVETIGQTARLIAWLASLGVEIKDLQKVTVKAALRRKALPDAARCALELRVSGAHAAAKKLQSMNAWCGEGDRVRGAFRYHGAATGRWASTGVQWQNLKRPETGDMSAAIEAVATGDLAHMQRLYKQPLSVIGDISRALIAAPPESRLLAGDFSGIESRVLAWLSGQQSKLDMWAKFDRTGDPADDPYRILGLACGIAPEQARGTGKTADLAFGYMGSIGAWRKLAPEDDVSTDEEIQARKQAWREAHPETVRFWYALDDAAKLAVRRPGKLVPCGKVAFVVEGDFLFMILPNQRRIAYPFPTLITNDHGYAVVSFKDRDQGRWVDTRHGHGAYGGTWCENAVQAVARDLLAEAMQRLQAANYPICLHVHDEVVCELPHGVGSTEEFHRLLIETPAWIAGLPIAAKVRNGPRFCKIEKPAEAIMPDETPSVPAPRIHNLSVLFNITSSLKADTILIPSNGFSGVVGVLEKGKKLLDAALGYARKGIPVFPCGPDKRPLTPHGFKDASCDPVTIIDWWRVNPTAFIGMPTGAASRIAVLDLDVKNGKNGLAEVPDWATRSPVIVRTGSDGRHLYFDAAGAPGCSSDKIALGVDTRGEGGYVVVPPSPGYSWTNGSDLSELPPWPDDLRPREREHAASDPGPPPPLSDYDLARVKLALSVTPSDTGYYPWLEIGCALRKCLGDAGWTLFDEWSCKSPEKYNAAGCRKKWNDCSALSAFNLGTIFHYADQACPGWRDIELPIPPLPLQSSNGGEVPPGASPETAGATISLEAMLAAAPAVLTAQAAKKKKGKLHFTCLADVEAEKVNWMWPNRLARGKIAILAGDSTLGKSQITTDWTARLTKIGMWPDGSPAPIGSVIILSAEDAIKDTIRPRFEAAGGDYSRVHCLSFVEGEDGTSQTFSLQDDLQALGDKIRAVGDVLMVVIDPITAYMGSKIDSHRVTDVRAVLAPLEKFAEQYDVAVLVVAHPAKASQVKAINIISGSAAFAQAPRLAFLVIEDPERIEDRRLLLAFKNSLGRKAPGLGYSIEEVMVGRCGDIPAPRIKWDVDPVTVTADEALAALADRKRAAAVTEAADFLRDRLAGGPVATAAIEKEAEERGITKRTLERARRKLNVKAKKEKGDFQGPWKLHLVVDNDAEDGSPPKDA